jgi:hypothetical protein
VTDAALMPGVRYNYNHRYGRRELADACGGNISTGLTGRRVLIQAILIAADDVVQTWHYDDTAVDRGTAWKEINYDDSSWKTGKAVFDAKDVPRTVVMGLNVGTQLQRRIPATPLRPLIFPPSTCARTSHHPGWNGRCHLPQA